MITESELTKMGHFEAMQHFFGHPGGAFRSWQEF